MEADMPVLLLGFFSLFVPRLVVLALWLFTDWFRGLFSTWLWLILGLIFLPTTLLWYSAVQHWFQGRWTFWPVVGLVLALLIDMSAGRKRSPAPPPPRRASRIPSHA
jgi:hypothetical protein